jgi:hypothetical protein
MALSSSSTVRSLILASLCLAASSCDQAGGRDRAPNVILVCMDTVRADHLGCYGYSARETTPFLDSIASEGLLFADASATACWTKPSVPSIFTGTLPLQHGVYRGSARDEAGTFSDVLPDEALTLAEAFGESGYQTGAFVRNSQLREGMGFEQGFDVYRDRAGDAREIRWRATDWLNDRDPERPFFLYLHYLDAHWPYAVPDEYASLYSDPTLVEGIRSGDWRALRDAVNDGEQELDPAVLEALVATYDGAIRYIDDQLARLWRDLERQGLAEDTILCVVADHGEEFLEHGKIGHGHGLYEGLLSVPWILRVPGEEARRIEARVSLVDLFPTLLSAAGIRGLDRSLPGVDRMSDAELRLPTISEHLESSRYHVSWTQSEDKCVEIVEPARGGGAAPTLAAMATGGRWEVRLDVDNSEARVAELVRPSEDQDEDELELKGPIAELSPSGFTIAGIPVEVGAGVELYGQIEDDRGESRPLAGGVLVKVKGSARQGSLVARKIKLYGPDDELELELRGPLSVLSSARVEVGGFEVELAETSVVDLGDGAEDLGPEDIAAILQGEVALEQRSVTSFDLGSDRAELTPREGGRLLEEPARLARLRELFESRVAGSGERKHLSAEEVGDLHALGYTE